jgi:hypothetical protein
VRLVSYHQAERLGSWPRGTNGFMIKPLSVCMAQGLERWEEAVLEIKDAINKGPGQQSVDAHNKLNQAEFLVRKSKRPDLYALIGVKFGCKVLLIGTLYCARVCQCIHRAALLSV